MAETDYVSVDLNIGVDQKEPYENLFQEWYPVDMHKDFLEKKENKKHNINNHSKWFRDKIKMNNKKQQLAEINKRKICFVNFWMNVWTEINGRRPVIIYKHDEYRYWEDIVVIPITSYEDEENKSKDRFDVEIEASETNWLDHKSLIKVRQIRCISKKRLQTWKDTGAVIIKGKIDDEEIKKLVDNNTRVMFGI